MACATLLPLHGALAQGALPSQVPVPADNPMTAAKIELGKQLYFDPRLSRSGTVSCNSCHNVMGNGADNLSLSLGVFGKVDKPRNTPTVFNAAFHAVQFWDGRAPSLEEQAKGPLLNPVEMGMSSGQAVADRVKAIPGYRTEFAQVFGGAEPVTLENVVKAIATYERTLITPNSPYDRFVKGNKNALGPAAQRGLHLAQTEGCFACHSGALFNGTQEATGKAFYAKFPIFTR
ncbi:MAG TPA: cytochrome-c peroxidase, partial [Betaproteobacteria bacterium]|nr:cytochrome-c peroxidase [Betaproteobacteria bacterium]